MPEAILMKSSLQDTYAPHGACFGCGPKNLKGLRLKSYPAGDVVKADWTPRPEHIAFGNIGNGGIISVLMDCHGNWTAAYSLMKSRGLRSPPGTVTAEYSVRFLRPSPIDREWKLRARTLKLEGDRATVSGELRVDGKVTASMTGTFVAVHRGHPAYYRWH